MIQAIFKPQYLFNPISNSILLKVGGICWLMMLISNYPALAQNTITINRDTVARPLTIMGTSGGGIKLAEIAKTGNTATGYCDGYADIQPNHLLEIESLFDSLRLEVTSSADTTVLVKGNSGVWCNDDAGSANPIIEGQWQQGLYKVWVGSHQPNTSNNYQIQITGN